MSAPSNALPTLFFDFQRYANPPANGMPTLCQRATFQPPYTPRRWKPPFRGLRPLGGSPAIAGKQFASLQGRSARGARNGRFRSRARGSQISAARRTCFGRTRDPSPDLFEHRRRRVGCWADLDLGLDPEPRVEGPLLGDVCAAFSPGECGTDRGPGAGSRERNPTESKRTCSMCGSVARRRTECRPNAAQN